MISVVYKYFMSNVSRHLLLQFFAGWQRVGIAVTWVVLRKLIKMREGKSCCWQCCHPLAKEFQRDKFSLTHEPADVFYKSQWQKHSRSILWLLYRWALAVCFTLGVLGSLIQNFNQGKWFIYLTDWGFFLCMFTSVFGAILATLYFFKPAKLSTGTRIQKIYWITHWSTLVMACVITFVYWIFIFPTDNSNPAGLYNLWAHAFNSILMILDHMLVAFPTRLLHFVYPLTVGFIYAVFTLIYYFAGGLDPNGNPYIYEILDWSKPGWAVGTVFACMLLVFIFCVLLFMLYKLRICIDRKSNNKVFTLNV